MRISVVVMLLLQGYLSCAFAQENNLLAIKIVPMPAKQVRLDFEFSQTLKQVPAHFIRQKPPRIILDFNHCNLHLPEEARQGKVTYYPLNAFSVVSADSAIRVLLDLDQLVSYSGSISGATYSLMLNSKRISLNFQHIDLRAVLQILADFTGMNLVVSDRVQGDITLKLDDIPWDQALDIILTSHGLDKRFSNKVMYIDKRQVLETKEQSKQHQHKSSKPLHSALFQINYAKAEDIAKSIREGSTTLLSDKGRLSVDGRTNTIWVEDQTDKLVALKRFIKHIDVPVKQVVIEARIVEVTKDFAQDIGIKWGIGNEGTSHDSTKGLNLDLPGLPVSLAPTASVGLALAKLADGILLDLELSALESEGRAKLISSPRLITTNRQTARIESGQDIPYQEATTSGATAVSFKKAVLSLKVKPQITPDGQVLMDLKINQDTALRQTYNGVPAIATKEIQTKVLVANGQTIVLGGIYRQDTNQSFNRLPFLGQLPVFGNLFRNKQITVNNEELLIFITPRILATVKQRKRINK